jgi:hypothetical protein
MSSSIPAPSAVDAETETRRLLTVAQTDRLRPFAWMRNVEREEILYGPGDVAGRLYFLL